MRATPTSLALPLLAGLLWPLAGAAALAWTLPHSRQPLALALLAFVIIVALIRPLPLIDFADAAEVAAGRAFVERLVRRAIDCGGTSTGEHGIGQSGLKYLSWEFDAAALEVMAALKRALDPNNIMNPGKLPGSFG